ncbi:hypothetical protein Bca101_092792 [Brassica carinata]
MAISPLSSAKTHSLCSMFLLLCFFFYVLCFVVLVCSSSSAQFCISSLVSSNPTISHKRHESGNWRFVLLLPFRWTVFFFLYVFLWTVTIRLTHHLTLTGYICSSTVWHGSSWMYPQTPHCSTRSHSKLVVDFAVSREQTNEKGEKMYIQTRMAEYAEELWELLKKKDNTFVYMCGWSQGGGGEPTKYLLYMVGGFETGIDWLEYKKQLKRSE